MLGKLQMDDCRIIHLKQKPTPPHFLNFYFVSLLKRSRSGRIVCPVLDYWRGQRMYASSDEGEITIIKSNLEEDSRLKLVCI